MATFFGAAESVSKFAPDRLRATVTNGFGFSSSSRWEISLPDINGMQKAGKGTVKVRSSSDDRNMLCSAASIPGKDIGTIERRNGSDLTPVGAVRTPGTAQFSFYLTNSYVMRHYFHEWMDAICGYGADPKNGNVQPMYVGYYQNYVRDVKINQYTRTARKAYSVKLIDAFPTQMSAVELNSSPQTQLTEITVQMTYRTFWADQNYESIVT